MDPYLEVLCREITARRPNGAGDGPARASSFYMGGGTPTTLSARQLDRLLTHLNEQL